MVFFKFRRFHPYQISEVSEVRGSQPNAMHFHKVGPPTSCKWSYNLLYKMAL